MARLLPFPSLGRDLASRAREGGAGYEPRRRALATVTEPRWLEARFPTDDRVDQARGLQSALRRLAAAQSALELGLGEGLEALHSRFDLRELGHSNLDALCTGRLGFSAAHGRELRRLATRLPELPLLREAFLAGLVPRTRVREVFEVATADDEAAWALLARRLTTRELKRHVREVKAARRAAATGSAAGSAAEGACAVEEDEDFVHVSWPASGAERATWEFTLALLRQLVGKRGPTWELAEALAAETLSACGPSELDEEPACRCVRSVSPDLRAGRQRLRAPSLRNTARKLERALRRAGGGLAPEDLTATPDFEACATAWDVLDGLVGLARRLAAMMSERARLLSWMQGRALYRELRHLSFHAWLERELGLGPRDARRLIDLQSRLALLPAIESAWQSGSVSTHQAWQLAGVAVPDTEVEWLEYARSVTPKLLDAAVEELRLAEVRAPAPPPPWDVPLRRLVLDWQEHFGLRQRRRLRVVGGACAPREAETNAREPESDGCEPEPSVCEPEANWCEPGGSAGALPGPWRLRRVGFWAPRAVARAWRQALEGVRAAAGTVLSDADCVRRMIAHLLEVHVTEEALERARRHRAIERDGWTCQMPHCRSTGPFHEHHRRFRSAGGSDDEWNLVTLCAPCHAMVHAGHVRILGTAPDELTFLLGTRREAWSGERRLARPALRASASPIPGHGSAAERTRQLRSGSVVMRPATRRPLRSSSPAARCSLFGAMPGTMG